MCLNGLYREAMQYSAMSCQGRAGLEPYNCMW